ncbi:MAG: hypothetical protein L0229_32280, partial [Blastocatellia bacterium]|nr:hypothetical protein [Blastocatellia bacterium]
MHKNSSARNRHTLAHTARDCKPWPGISSNSRRVDQTDLSLYPFLALLTPFTHLSLIANLS